MSQDEDVTMVTEGESINLALSGHQAKTEFTVAPNCATDVGAWACVTHNKAFRNPFESAAHLEGGRHKMVWICVEHGPEVP